MARLTPEEAQLLVGLRPVTEDMLAAPPDHAWLMWRRTPDSTGFSPLKQVDRGNVRGLREQWRLRLDPSGNEITPLVHDGVLFAYSGASIQAVDAASGSRCGSTRIGAAPALIEAG